MGLLTITHQAMEFRPDPSNPQNVQIRILPDVSSTQLANLGVRLQVEISVDNVTANYFLSQNQQIPQAMKCDALLDTGASCLCIDSSIAQQLKLARKGIAASLTANGPRQSNLYAVSISFFGGSLRRYDVIRAADVDLSKQPFKCLIGRDIMRRWHVHYNGQTGTVSIAD